MGTDLQRNSRKPDPRPIFQFPIKLRMAFLVKYLAFVVAFLSAANLGEGINVTLVNPTNAESIQEYADLVKKAHCEIFDPHSSHMDAIGDDATTLARLLKLHYQGDNIEICAVKEEDRWGNWKSDLTWGVKTAASLVAIGTSVAVLAG